MDPIEAFKDAQKKGWAHFAPLEMQTTPPAAKLVKHAGIRAGQRVLDVACGTGVVAVTAARMGAHVSGLDLTPELIERARHNSKTADVSVDWHEGDAEKLPFEDSHFDVVVSQFGHMFAPRPDIATAEMLRVLKPAGTIAFSTWPPDQFIGRMFMLVASYLPPPPPGVSSPVQWGEQKIVRERLAGAVKDVAFDTGTMATPVLSPQHNRTMMEKTAGPVIKLVAELTTSNPVKLAEFRQKYESLLGEYLQDNIVRQEFLMTRATKF